MTQQQNGQPQVMSVDEVKYRMLLDRIGNMERRHTDEMANMEIHYMQQIEEKNQELQAMADQLSKSEQKGGKAVASTD